MSAPAAEPPAEARRVEAVADDDELADPLCRIAERGAAERRILGQQPLQRGDLGLGDRLGEHRLPTWRRRGGEQAGIARREAVENDLAAGVGGQAGGRPRPLDDDPADAPRRAAGDWPR